MQRRRFLQAGSLVLGGLGLTELLRLRALAANGKSSEPNTAVVLLWLESGPGHMAPNDFLASVYRFLGIDSGHPFPDRHGRPMPILTRGRPICELV